MIIEGSAVFMCPKKKKEVRLDISCLNADGKGNQCVFFKHWMWSGAHPLICCDYKQPEENKEETQNKKEEMEEEETGTGKEWRQPQFIDTEE